MASIRLKEKHMAGQMKTKPAVEMYTARDQICANLLPKFACLTRILHITKRWDANRNEREQSITSKHNLWFKNELAQY